MALSLCASMRSLSLQPQAKPVAKFGFSSSMRGQALVASRPATAVRASSVFEVVAKQNSLQRQKVAEKARQRNKARKSAIRTRMKKVFVAIDEFKGSLPTSEDQVKPVEKLISEAFQEIDKAVAKGTMHVNTGARRKERMSRAKRTLLVEAGLYTPQ